jgi:Patatin-like phospholipase
MAETWRDWLNQFQTDDPVPVKACDFLQLPDSVAKQEWDPVTADQTAAWDLYTELRTRITVQPLHYLHGDEETALTSVADLFKMSRDMIRKAGPRARHFATLTVFALNRVIRPFTAKWHKAKCEGKLANEDDRHRLRGELSELQKGLRLFATVLGALAEGAGFCKDSESWPTAAGGGAATADGAIPFDIAFDEFVDKTVAAKIRWEEYNEIHKRRAATRIDLPRPGDNHLPGVATRLKDVSGLALSGGGIRSATFGLGVVQRLVKAGVAQHFDYLSTVSGGGYLGSFLSAYLNTDNTDKVALTKDKLPFCKPDVGESAPLRHLRGHSKYLIKGGLVNRMNMVLLAVYGVVSTVLIFWPLLAGALLLVAYYHAPAMSAIKGGTFDPVAVLKHGWVIGPALGAIVLLLSLAPAVIVCRCARTEDKALFGYQKVIAVVIAGALLIILWNLLPILFWGVNQLQSDSHWKDWLPKTAALSGAVAAIQRFWANLDWAPAASKLKRALAFLAMALAGPLLVVTLFLWLGQRWVIEGIIDVPQLASSTTVWLLWLTFAPLVFAILFLDINHSSLHPFYRRKLSEAYLIADVPSEKTAGEVRADDGVKLTELRNKNPRAPYHLINCALEAPSSDNQAVRGRGTDFFFFSQKYSGSAATGYFETAAWEGKDSHLNLGTAMAVSAAAASPFMGVGSIAGGNFLLTLFNVRLDYWLASPRYRYWHWLPFVWRAGPWYLLRQGFGWMEDRSLYVDVSDGGHIENLALYELLRRRCKFIVAVDGECDPEIHCGSLMQLMRYALIDFGIDIDIDLSRLKKGPAGTVPFHFALARVTYPKLNADSPVATGYLLYVKLSLTGNEPPSVADYRTRHADFPHESTADQFFDEDQFEAYRALGEHAADDLFSSELLGKNTEPGSLAKWFEAVSRALRDPNVR